jgi:hypothetical protein
MYQLAVIQGIASAAYGRTNLRLPSCELLGLAIFRFLRRRIIRPPRSIAAVRLFGLRLRVHADHLPRSVIRLRRQQASPTRADGSGTGWLVLNRCYSALIHERRLMWVCPPTRVDGVRNTSRSPDSSTNRRCSRPTQFGYRLIRTRCTTTSSSSQYSPQ